MDKILLQQLKKYFELIENSKGISLKTFATQHRIHYESLVSWLKGTVTPNVENKKALLRAVSMDCSIDNITDIALESQIVFINLFRNIDNLDMLTDFDFVIFLQHRVKYGQSSLYQEEGTLEYTQWQKENFSNNFEKLYNFLKDIVSLSEIELQERLNCIFDKESALSIYKTLCDYDLVSNQKIYIGSWLSVKLEISKSQISQWKNKHSIPDEKSLRRIYKLFNLKFGALFNQVDISERYFFNIFNQKLRDDFEETERDRLQNEAIEYYTKIVFMFLSKYDNICNLYFEIFDFVKNNSNYSLESRYLISNFFTCICELQYFIDERDTSEEKNSNLGLRDIQLLTIEEASNKLDFTGELLSQIENKEMFELLENELSQYITEPEREIVEKFLKFVESNKNEFCIVDLSRMKILVNKLRESK